MESSNRVMFSLLMFIRFTIILSEKHTLIDNYMNGLIASFGDFDSDKMTDVFLITDNGKSIEIAKGFIEKEPLLQKWPNIKCGFDNTSDDVIVGLIPSDFSGKAMMDLLVVTQEINFSKKTEPKFKLWLFKGNYSHLECNTTVPLAHNIKSHPLILDFNGDMIADFIVESDQCLRQLWTNLSPSCPKKIQSNQTMSYPNSNAFINLNHPFDSIHMSPDIHISGTNHIEYWFNNQGFESTNIKFIGYPDKEIYKYIGQSSFLDINFDGKIDHIIPVCKSAIESCVEPQILALVNDESEFQWIKISDFGNESENHSLLTFTKIKKFNYLELFVTLRTGDIDSDGYPDLVTVMRDRNGTKTHAVILKNIASNDNKFKRKFIIHWTSDQILKTNGRPDNNVDLAAFFDFYEDGKVDVLFGSSDQNNSLYLDVYINNEKYCSSFLKVLVTSGRCYSEMCPNEDIAYGTNQFGPFLCFSPSDGHKISCSGQLSQSAHFVLQMPYIIFGLGDIPNFIENLSVSIPSGTMQSRQQTWFEMIPDAKIVIIPYPANKTHLWIQKLFLNPSHFAFSTLITLTSICCILVTIIAILHKLELSEDVVDHKEYKKHWL